MNKESFFTVIHIVCKTKQGNWVPGLSLEPHCPAWQGEGHEAVTCLKCASSLGCAVRVSTLQAPDLVQRNKGKHPDDFLLITCWNNTLGMFRYIWLNKLCYKIYFTCSFLLFFLMWYQINDVAYTVYPPDGQLLWRSSSETASLPSAQVLPRSPRCLDY